mgnify:CR=1 FL=1
MMQDIDIQNSGSIVVPAANGATRSIEVFEPAIDTFKDLYFRGQFQKLISAIDAMDSNRLSTTAFFKMNLLKTSALFEMHRTTEAKDLINTLGQLSPDESQSPDYVHMIARLRYLDDNHEAAGLLWRQLLTQEGAEDQKFKSAEKLVGIFKLNGISKEENVVAYCRSGVRSAHTTFVLTELLGYPNVYNYDGSWLEWSSIDELPVELKAI